MKRSGPLKRSTALRRSSPLRASRSRSLGVDPSLRDEVMSRDRGCRAAGLVRDVRCWGRIDPHHLRRRSQGGLDSADNLIAVCRAHHDWIHEHPMIASTLGLLILSATREPPGSP